MTDVVEYGPTGPTQVKDITPPSNMSPQAAAFIAANASPFTNPRDMPAPAKVPDPRNTMDTDTMFIWGHIEVPTHVLTTGAYGMNIVSNPDPLAPLPLWISQSSGDQHDASPNNWAILYERYGLHDVVAQADMLARRSKSYRVVGHGLKAWCSRSATIGSGNITGYQFDFASAPSFHSGSAIGAGLSVWKNPPASDAGFQASLIACDSSLSCGTALSIAKNDEIGFLQADEGVTLRWTDRSDFAFKPTQSMSCVHPLRKTCSVSATDDFLQVVNTSANGAIPSIASAAFATPPHNGATATPTLVGFNSYRLCTYASTLSASSVPQTSMSGAASTAEMFYYTPCPTQSLLNYGCATNGNPAPFNSYSSNPKSQFDTGLAVEVGGMALGSTVIIQVVWHIEYVPNGVEPWSSSLPSPVDLQYDVYASLLRDRRAFPIVVKGHSFFSNLRKALAKAGKSLVKVFGGVGAASAALSVVPGLQPFAALGGSIAAVGTATIGAVSMIDAAYDEIAESGRAAKRAMRG